MLTEDKFIFDFTEEESNLINGLSMERKQQIEKDLFGEAMISNNLLTFDNSIEALGITEEEWNDLSIEEKDRILKCS
jgi:hypothetical protein